MPNYSPFDKALEEIQPSNLARVTSISEGWYVEYKSRLLPVRTIAKSLAAFANQYGGWLFLGVEDDSLTLTARAFPGIEVSQIPLALESLRNASKDVLNPEVFYDTRELVGPIAEVGLAAGYAVIVIHIPQGPEPPYVHNDGRVYRRVADASDPKPETDRAVLDRLWDRGQSSRRRLEKFVTQLPVTSEGEESAPFLHLTLMRTRTVGAFLVVVRLREEVSPCMGDWSPKLGPLFQ